MNENIIKLAVDLYRQGSINVNDSHGQVRNFSASESNEILREKFMELAGFTEKRDKQAERLAFRRNKTEIFEILEVIINETLHEGLKSQFDGFAEYRNLAWGDENLFKVPANNLFRVALVSDGNGNIRRQRLRDGQEFSVSLDTYAIKVGEDFHRFLAKRVDWIEFMDGIAESFRRDITQKIAKAVMDSHGEYGAVYHPTLTSVPTEDEIVEMAMHIQARTGEKVAIHGTKLAIRRLSPTAMSDSMADEKNKNGVLGVLAGIELREIEQSHEYGSDTFAIDNNFILLLPENKDRMVKVVNEGDAIIQDVQGGMTADMMQEYFIANKMGVSIITSKVYGFIKFA